jgi:alkylhydroperoxidase/carboxymuconolactone decarboxylase family protein YurZ
MLRKAGFEGAELAAETGYNSSPKTKGVLILATKPEERFVEETLDKYQQFFDMVYAEGHIDRKTKHLIALGASLGAGCDP